MQICRSCGEENPDRFRICGMCGAQLAPEAPAQDVRKTVSIVFSDLKGSTSLGERLDTESLREILSQYFADMQAVLERHGGTVEKFIGDAIMAVFGLPVVHEDDPMRAVRAALEMRETLARFNERLELTYGVRLENRTGVNTGDVVAGDVTHGQRLVTGDAVNVAARLEQNAPSTEILIGESTYRLVKDAVEVKPVEPLELKGKSQPMQAYLLISASRGEGIARRLDTPIVGRENELSTLSRALAEARTSRQARLVTVVAPAGVGKSRLLQEFLRASAEIAPSLRGRCLPYGDGITFWPLSEITREAAGIENDDSLDIAKAKLAALLGADSGVVGERLAAAIGLSSATYPVQETFWATRQLLRIVAADRPLIVLIDDIHWAEPTFLDLIQYVVDSAEDTAVVIACSTRPELIEEHPEWFEARPHASTIILEPLSLEDSSKVVENLLGSSALDERARARVIEAAEGNPLFVEQMLSMLIDDGILSRDANGAWVLTSDLGSFTIPPTISALLSARLDRLSVPERSVIERGAVIGQVFFRGAVEELAPETVRPHVEGSLDNLTRKELIGPHESSFAGEAFRFLHMLIRDAAYQGLLKRNRAELHERFVDWLERASPDRTTEYEEIRGYHLEQAYVTTLELGLPDERVVRLGKRGAAYLSSAGNRALARGDLAAAAKLLQRASALLSSDDPERLQLLIQAGDSLILAGEFETAETVLAAAGQDAAAFGDRGLETRAEMVRLLLHLWVPGPEDSQEVLTDAAERAIPVLEQLGDHEGLARAWRLLANVHLAACMYNAAEDATKKLLEHARLAGDAVMANRHLPILTFCAFSGPTPVPAAIDVCEQVLEQAQGDRRAEAQTKCILAHLEAMQGRFDRARELCRTTRAVLEEFGWKLDAAQTSIDSGPIELLAGDPIAAEAELRRAYDTLRAMGDTYFLTTTAVYLAEALYQQDRLDEAEEFSRVSEEAADDDDVTSQVLWRAVRGKLLARWGRFDEAESLARDAVRRIRETQDVGTLGESLLALAEVLMLVQKNAEAHTVLAEVLHLFEDKGNDVSAARVRELIESLTIDGGGTLSPRASVAPTQPR